MKSPIKEYGLLSLLLVSSQLLSIQAAEASVTFNNSATVTYTINSVTNLSASNPNDLSALSILGSFEQASSAPNFYSVTSGDGNLIANNPTLSSIAVGSSFSHTFNVSGSAQNGAVDSLNTGWLNLDFNNLGTDNYAIDVTLSYQLNTSTSGLYANSNIALDYFNIDSSFNGSDSAIAYTFAGNSVDSALVTGSKNLNFSLGAGQNESIYADTLITGNLAPVPVPGSIWLFLTGIIGVLGVNKRKLVTA